MKIGIFLILCSFCLCYYAEAKSIENSSEASERLMKELRDCRRSAAYKNNEYSIELADDSLYSWNVLVRFTDPKHKQSQIYKDLQKLNEVEGVDGILINIKFSANYPSEVPVIRIVHPEIKVDSLDGAIKMDLLQIWKSRFTVETIIRHLRSTIIYENGHIVFDQGSEAGRGYQMVEATECCA